MNLKQRIKRKIQKVIFGNKASSEEYVSYLRNLGMKIGDRVVIFSPRHTLIDETSPWMIEIGNDVQIPHGVTILTHGYDWSVLKGAYGDVLGSSGGVKIGNNVFIGMNTTILKGTTIGDNVIIGAGSVVVSDVPPNSTVVGVPGKVVKQDGERVNRIQSIVLDQIDLPNPVDMDIEKLARENAELRQALETFIIHYQNSEAIRREKEK